MKSIKSCINLSLLIASIGYSACGLSHSGGATLGADGTNASATGLAAITCEDDGNGEPEGLFVQIKDLSEPVTGLFINIQLYKGTQATSTTDTISGDADFSEGVQLNGGAGTYQMILNKTNVGARAFEVVWHCMTADHTHTGTDIVVRQFQ